ACVERHRTVMERGLHQPNTRGVFVARAFDYVTHQGTAHAAVLIARLDCDWADAFDYGAFIHAIAAHDSPVSFGDDRVNSWRGEHGREHADCGLRCREVAGEAVLPVQG